MSKLVDVDRNEPTPPSELSTAVATMAEILRELRSSHGGEDKRIEILAAGIQTLVNAENARPRENPQYPAMSFTNPLGELAKPRAELVCRMFWVGYRLLKDALTHEEIAALNTIQAGEYRVTKADGSSIPFTVAAKLDLAGKLERKTFHFPCKNSGDRTNHMPMLSYLKEAMGELAPNVDRLMRQVLDLQAQLNQKPS